MVNLNLKRIQTECSIEGCLNVQNGMPLDRHHVRSQKLFVHAFRDRPSRRYRAFVRRYEEFREPDICRLCRLHHEAAHFMYYMIVDRHLRKIGKPLWQWSWRQANILMEELEKEFWKWKRHQEQGLKKLSEQASGNRSLSRAGG